METARATSLLAKLLFVYSLALSACAAVAELAFDPGVSLGVINSGKLTEGSGIAVSSLNPGVFWTHNDGPRDSIYAFRMDGTLLATFKLGKTVDDIEDIATGPGPIPGVRYIYVGDVGSNNATRDNVRILRVQEPVVDPAWAANPVSKDFKSVDVCHLKYVDGTYDAECLLVDPEEPALYVATKQSNGSRLYKIALGRIEDGKTKDMEFVLYVPFLKVSGGSVAADGSLVALRREDFAMAWTRVPGETVVDALSRDGVPIPVIGPPTEANGEGIAFLPDGSGYATLSEGLNQPVYFFRKTPEIPPCVDPPRFVGHPLIERGRVVLSFLGCPDSVVALEKSVNLRDWSELVSAQMTANPESYLDLLGPAPGFYRLRRIP